MTIIVKTITRITLGFILLYGIYIALHGHISPGGGFAGGVIVALSFVHIMLAFGKEIGLKTIHAYTLRIAVSIAALSFIFAWVRNSLRGNEITMPLSETVVVGGGLFAIFIALVLLSKPDKDAE
jgi:multicomponent Na+:H+ antiporter subunit B